MARSISYSRKGIIVGVLILAVGSVLLLDQMGYVSADYVFRFFWPAVFIFFGIEVAACRNSPSRLVVGVLMLCFGVLLLFGSLGVLHVGINTLWPLLLIIWGVWVIGRAFGADDSRWKYRFGYRGVDRSADTTPNQPPATENSPNPSGPSSNQSPPDLADQIKYAVHANIKSRIEEGFKSSKTTAENWSAKFSGNPEFDYVAIFGGVKQRITVKNFRGGRILAICGGWDIDLTRADIDGDTAVIEANALMGGGEIRVPDSWVVEFRGVPLLGGYSDETHQMITDPAKAKRLIIRGIACMGGIVIKN
jgi:hypothetical protein